MCVTQTGENKILTAGVTFDCADQMTKFVQGEKKQAGSFHFLFSSVLADTQEVKHNCHETYRTLAMQTMAVQIIGMNTVKVFVFM